MLECVVGKKASNARSHLAGQRGAGRAWPVAAEAVVADVADVDGPGGTLGFPSWIAKR